MIGSYRFSQFLYFLRFWDWGIHFWQFHKTIMFGWLRKSRSTSGFTGARGYWWLSLMEFRNFFIVLRFWGQGIHFCQFHEAAMFGWPRKSRSTSGFTGAQGYWWLGHMDFRNFFIFYVFEVEESIFEIFTKLTCLGDFENPGQLPILQVLEGTDDCVLCIFRNFFIFYVFEVKVSIFGSFTKLHVWVTLKIQVNFRFHRCSKVLMIVPYGFS